MTPSPTSTHSTWIVLLRGINVGRAKRVAMADLRELLKSLAFANVRTVLQSGNALFTTASRGSAAAIEKAVTTAIDEQLGLDVKVVARTAPEFDAVVAANPFVPKGVDAKELHVAFLGTAPPAAKVHGIDATEFAPDGFVFGDRVIYLHRPNGVQGSTLPDWSRLLGVTVTERNWNTVHRLHELLSK
jgi:uncharacterized protein (DUF1697 family)